MYNNEVKNGVQQGYWLIDDHGRRQTVDETHWRFLERARAYVTAFLAREGRVLTREEYQAAAPDWLEVPAANNQQPITPLASGGAEPKA